MPYSKFMCSRAASEEETVVLVIDLLCLVLNASQKAAYTMAVAQKCFSPHMAVRQGVWGQR